MPLKARGFKGPSLAPIWGATTFGKTGPESYLYHKKTGVADGVATGIIRVSAPNVNVSALLKLELLAAVNNGGALESTRVALGYIAFSRIAGANLVGTADTLSNAGIATSGLATLTLAYGVATVAGGVAAVNTMDVQVTLTGSGSFTDHQICVRAALLLNSNNLSMSVL